MSNKLLTLVITASLWLAANAQHPEIRAQHNLAKWHITSANYSGIIRIDTNLYALVDDKSHTEGFRLFHIDIDPNTGNITHVDTSDLIHPSHPDSLSSRADCEDIVYVPQSNTVFITHEHTARVKEYTLQGELTGRELHIPESISLDKQQINGGFEALAYNTTTGTFWLTTENKLKTDTLVTDIDGNMRQPLRLTSFNHNLEPMGLKLYLMEQAQLPTNVKYYTHGVPAMTAMPDGRLIVMERELSIPARYLGGRSLIRIFVVNPADTPSPLTPLPKQELASFTTKIRVIAPNYANYEGMCLGPTLTDGRQTLILVNDSQAGAGNSLYRLKDYLKILVLPKNF
ncbi:MAG: esterase-like activity of phytase family protein [Bacteroidaceae bacterium]|nr:esterase-like activity of phytase family protein [Prevotellaceae bacterium]MDY2849269.1 esterase-like activity of phytase family protein [Bacteroidaceae bacterium]